MWASWVITTTLAFLAQANSSGGRQHRYVGRHPLNTWRPGPDESLSDVLYTHPWLNGVAVWSRVQVKLQSWSDWKMLSGTEREETRKIASLCAVSPEQCTLLTHYHNLKCWFQNFPLPTLFAIPVISDPGSSVYFWNWRNSWNDLEICWQWWCANGWLEDQHREFCYSRTQAMEKRGAKCISVEGDYIEKWQNNICCLLTVSATNFLNAHCNYGNVVCLCFYGEGTM